MKVEIPARFWATLPHEQFAEIVFSGRLNADQCQRLWRMTDRQDIPPASLRVLVNRADVLKLAGQKC